MSHSFRTVSSDALRRPGSAPLAARRPAELFLESLQERVYGAVGVTAEDCQQRERVGQQTILPLRLQQKAEELSPGDFAQYRSAVIEALARDETSPRPTAFERPHQYSILRDLKAAVETAATQLSLELPFVPVVGTLPTRLLEPLMVRVPETSEVVLLVDGALLTYVHLLAKAIAHALPFELLEDLALSSPPPRGWEPMIDPDGHATQRFAELMLAVIGGNAASAPAYVPVPSCEQMTAGLCECMELFIVAREYARLCEGDHLDAGCERRHAHGQSFEALVWTARQELHADALGMGLLLAAAREKHESMRFAFWSADLLLAGFGLIDRSLMALESPGALPCVSLPRSLFDERRKRLRDLMTQLEGGDATVTAVAALDPVFRTLADRFDVILDDLRFGPQAKH